MAVESKVQADDLAEEDNDIKTGYPDFSGSSTTRLSFFTKSFSTTRGLTSVSGNEFIGYALVKEDKVQSRPNVSFHVYESVVRPSRRENNFIRGAQPWSCQVAGTPLQVSGYLYAQQNDLTNVCAHVALRTAAARFHPDGDMTYGEMNRIVGVDHVNRKVGGSDANGLDTTEMVQILERAGATCFPAEYTGIDQPAPFQKYVYGSVESGYPAIVVFATTIDPRWSHAVPLFGHTFNEDTWVPSAELSYFRVGRGTRYIPSESWVSAFIGHDDNWGSNFCIPRHFLYTRNACTRFDASPQPCPDQTECVTYVIATYPKVIKVSAIQAEVIGADYLAKMLDHLPSASAVWQRRLSWYNERNLLVFRPLLVWGHEYANHLGRIRDWENNAISQSIIRTIRATFAEEFFWMVELSVPELFSANKRKVGELLIRAQIGAGTERDFRSFYLARMPGCFVLYRGGGGSKPQYAFAPSGAPGHVELYGCEEAGGH